MDDHTPVRHGEPLTPTGTCSHSGPDNDQPCDQPASYHVVAIDASNSWYSLSACVDHALIAVQVPLARRDRWWAHPLYDNCTAPDRRLVSGSPCVREGDSLRDRIQMLKGTLEVKDEVDELKDRVDDILESLGDRDDGAWLIRVERDRQIAEEGWTPEHDLEHDLGTLAEAAVAYTIEGIARQGDWVNYPHSQPGERTDWWPWDPEWWKPSDDPVRNLVKAGALIAAEIDRLLAQEAADG